MRIYVINGPNMNMLGIREPELYGEGRLADLEQLVKKHCDALGIECEFFQSNHEGELVDIIQSAYDRADGIIINAAAYTHTSVAILDALKAAGVPTVEVHMTDISKREDFRKFSFVSLYAFRTIAGKGFNGYLEAVDILASYDRVKRMEELMDKVGEAVEDARYEGFESDVRTLEEYYAKDWRMDFELDEAGVFPKELKRGVLSEDGLFDLLENVEKRQ